MEKDRFERIFVDCIFLNEYVTNVFELFDCFEISNFIVILSRQKIKKKMCI